MGRRVVFVVIVGLTGLAGSPAAGMYGGGSGEPNDPYLIYDANQMHWIGVHEWDWGKHFKLMADVNLAELDVPFAVIGWTSEQAFSGVFDGNGHTISNLSVDHITPERSNAGLFGVVAGEDAVIKNLGLVDPNVRGTYRVGALVGLLSKAAVTNCYVVGGSVYGDDEDVGKLVGTSSEGALISHCYAAGTVSGDETVGGLVGLNANSTILKCYFNGSVSGANEVGGLVGANLEDGTISQCYANADVLVRGDAAGGLAGRNTYGSTISNCYATGAVSGDSRIGGLVGENSLNSAISHCYSTGMVSGEGAQLGGLVGFNFESTVSLSFWDVGTSGKDSSPGGTGKTTAEMKQRSTFTDWDFINVWGIGQNQTYPYLREYSGADINHDGVVNLLDFAVIADQWMQEQ